MNKFLYLIPFLFISLFCFSQTQKKETSNKLKPDDEFDIKKYKGEPGDRLIIEINRTIWMGVPSDIKPNWRSLGLNFAFMFENVFFFFISITDDIIIYLCLLCEDQESFQCYSFQE